MTNMLENDKPTKKYENKKLVKNKMNKKQNKVLKKKT